MDQVSTANKLQSNARDDLLPELIKVLQNFLELQTAASELVNHPVCTKVLGIKGQLTNYGEYIARQYSKLRGFIDDNNQEIRLGHDKNVILKKQVENLSHSPFAVNRLERWLADKHLEIEFLDNCFASLKEFPFVIDGSDLKIYTANGRFKHVVVLQFGAVTNKFDEFLEQMSDFLKLEINDDFDDSNSEVGDDLEDYCLWFNNMDKRSFLKNSINSILSFKKVNEMNEDLKCVVNTSIGRKLMFENPGNIVLFIEGKISQFRIPGILTAPKCVIATENSIKLQWNKPESGFESVTAYIVRYKKLEEETEIELLFTKEIQSDVTEIDIMDLKKGSLYVFQVASKCKVGNSEFSDWSEPIRTANQKQLETEPSLGAQMSQKCLPIKQAINGQPTWYQLPLKKVYVDMDNRLHIFEVFEPIEFEKENKVILLVGATGSGKTTLINGLVNYMLGVRFEDNYRFQLILENVNKSQAKSQTKTITAYKIHCKYGSKIPYTLTIIDTPGFGDSRGITRDCSIEKQINKFFNIRDSCGIKHIDAIGFVAQASEARLTSTQRYIFDCILSMFGKDVSGNIFMMLTFADGRTPQILDAIKEHRLPYQAYFKFNNSVYTQIGTNERKENKFAAASVYSVAKFDIMFWELASDSFSVFLNQLSSVKPVNLKLTREVLEERNKLNAVVDGLKSRINKGLDNLETMRQHLLVIEEFVAEKKANKDFKRQVEVPKTKKIEFGEKDKCVTNCLTCHVTCHKTCGISDDKKKYKCSVMNAKNKNSVCTICDNRCPWSAHHNIHYYFEEYKELEFVTIKELEEKYKSADKNLSEKENLIVGLGEQYTKVQLEILNDIEIVQKSLTRLDEIAMKPNPLSTVDYIDILIENAKREKHQYWQQRVSQLEIAKERAELIRTIIDEGEKYAPFERIKNTIIEESKKSGVENVIKTIKHFFGTSNVYVSENPSDFGNLGWKFGYIDITVSNF